MNSAFTNEAFTDFTVAAERDKLEQAVDSCSRRLERGAIEVCPIVGGKPRSSRAVQRRPNPADPSQAVSAVAMADSATAREALQTARAAQPAWEASGWERRAAVLRNAASEMRLRKHELSALIIFEAGKPWREADADVAEAIDFCDYYAEEALRLSAPRKTDQVPGEENWYFYQPRGVCVVIAPWNFPLAIACGMAAAALVTGNTVVLKPAEQTSAIAQELCRILHKAGVPDGALSFLPGVGEEIGPILVDSPLTDMIVFTGSRGVGLDIISRASVVHPGQQGIKKVVAELGGKNAVIIDQDADLDEAIKGVLYSAFGFAGQKCSAASRIIAVGSAYEPFVKRFCEAAGDIIVGKPSDSATLLGPVIDAEAQERIMRVIEQGKKSLKLAFQGAVPDSGSFVPATIFREVPPDSALWREEIFGPVVCCAQAASFDAALDAANDCVYALTGGLFSRSPANIAEAKSKFRVGNLYINRGCTGALVRRQPFGGFRMSGVGSKAGGPDYLLQFLEPRTVTENTMRRGFSPQD